MESFSEMQIPHFESSTKVNLKDGWITPEGVFYGCTPEEHDECARFLTNCIIFDNAYILSVLLTEAEKTGRIEEAEITKRISPIAWRHVNLIGRFEFQKQQNLFNIDEVISVLTKKTAWQKLKIIGEAAEHKTQFTFSGV